VCYKPEMRKWMSERLKRRKKEPDKAGTEATPAPLQPAFYDTEPAHPEAAAEGRQPTSAPLQPESAQEMPLAEPQPAQSRQAVNGDVAKRRRRRGRGGRGRSRNGAAPVEPAAASSEPGPIQAASKEVEPSPVAAPHGRAAARVAPTPPQVEAARPSKGVVVLAIGLPGSGKSSWFKRHNITPLSSDLLRALLFDDPTEQRFQDLIFSNLRSMLKARLIARRPMNYVDATNLSPHERSGWIKLAKDYGYEVQAVFFDVPVEVCLARNQRRERKVPEDAMRRMAGKLKQPTFEEGFSKITVVKVKQKD
jgi:predicted kinase